MLLSLLIAVLLLLLIVVEDGLSLEHDQQHEKGGEEDYTKFFNAESGDAIGDTYIPRQNQKFVQANQDMFSKFDSSKNKGSK